jgi:hypothetical protein
MMLLIIHIAVKEIMLVKRVGFGWVSVLKKYKEAFVWHESQTCAMGGGAQRPQSFFRKNRKEFIL